VETGLDGQIDGRVALPKRSKIGARDIIIIIMIIIIITDKKFTGRKPTSYVQFNDKIKVNAYSKMSIKHKSLLFECV